MKVLRRLLRIDHEDPFEDVELEADKVLVYQTAHDMRSAAEVLMHRATELREEIEGGRRARRTR